MGISCGKRLDAVLANVEATVASLKYERAIRKNAKDDSAVKKIEHLVDEVRKAERDIFV